MEQVASGRVRLDDIITHRLPLTEVAHACKIFNGKKEGCVKVVMAQPHTGSCSAAAASTGSSR